MSRYDGRLPQTYENAVRALQGKDERPLTSNTRVRRALIGQGGPRIEVTYHGHVIATFWASGARLYTQAGHSTSSTHQRLNAMTPPGTAFIRQMGAGIIVINHGRGKTQRVASTSYDLMIHPDGRREAVRRKH